MQRLEFYKLAKKTNSTLLPDANTAKKVITGYLREPCSVIEPVIKIDANFAKAENPTIRPFEWTYCYWTEANRYYFVTDWVWQEGLWEVHMKEDVLASFRTEIGSASEYILRTDSGGEEFNGTITDTTYPTTTEATVETVILDNVFTDDLTLGCFIVGIISGDDANSVGAVTYYALSATQFGSLKEMLYSEDNLQVMGILDSQGLPLVQDMSKEILKTLYNPYQYIVSCMFLPCPISIFSTMVVPVQTIQIGWWTYNLSGNRLTGTKTSTAENPTTLTGHPQAEDRGYYLNYAPYTKRYIIGRFGTVAIDTFKFEIGDAVAIYYTIDIVTGQCRAEIGRLRDYDFDLFTVRDFLLGVPIQLAQVGQDYLGTVATAISAAPAITAGSAIGGAIGGTVGAFVGGMIGGAKGIYNTIQSSMPILETSGANGSFLTANLETHLVTEFFNLVEEDLEHRGRPLCDIRTINTLSGFIQCADGELDISCYDSEKKAIYDFLTNGFFWE